MKRCMYCGHENVDSLTSCSVCGNKLGNALLTQEPVTAEEAAAQESMPDEAGASGGMTEDGVQRAAGAGEMPGGAQKDAAGDDSYGAQPDAQYGASEASDSQSAADEAMYSQEPAFAGQIPVNSQFGETAPAGQFQDGENTYAGQPAGGNAGPYTGENPYASQYTGENPYTGQTPDMTPGYGEDWRQDVGRGQTYGARTQYRERREARRSQNAQREGVSGGVYNNGSNQYGASGRDQYGSSGYGYRQPRGQEVQGARGDYGRRESTGGSKMFMVKARKRVKSVTFFLMALTFTAMFALNVYNIYCGNALRNITDSESMLANILGGNNTFFTQILTELCSQLVSMIVNVYGIAKQLGDNVMLGILLVFLIPNALYCLALWLMFGQTDIRRRQFSMGGYTLARVMWVLKFIIACIVLGIGLVISLYFVVVGASSAQFTSSFIEGLLMLILMIVITLFVILYYIQWMFCLKVVKLNSKTGADPGKMPGYVAFISIIAAALCGLLMVPMAPNDYIGLAARGSAAGYFLFMGLWVIIYKIKVKRN